MTAEDLPEASSGRAGFGSRQGVCRAVPSSRRRAHQTSIAEAPGLGIHARRLLGTATAAGHFESRLLSQTLAARSKDGIGSELLEYQ